MPYTPFAEDPHDIPAPNCPPPSSQSPRTPVGAELLAKAAKVVEAARWVVTAEQVRVAKEAVERIMLEGEIGRQKEIAADLEAQIGVMETVVEYLLYVVGEREEEIEELKEETGRLRRKPGRLGV